MRRTLSVLVLGALLGGVLMAALPSVAGNGDAIYLGERNTARRVTKVNTKSGIIFGTTKAATPAATFNVVSGPPIAVNSEWKVDDLNADQLDYMDASDLQTMTEWWYVTDIDDDEEWSTKVHTIYAPTGGTLLMSGSVDFTNNKTSADWVACHFLIDGLSLSWTHMTTWAEPGESGICSSTGVFSFVNPGTYEVRFTTVGMSPSEIAGDQGTWWVLYIPEPVM